MTRWLCSILLVGIAWSYELIPADLEKPVPPFVHDIENRRLELPFAATATATDARRCVHAFTAAGRRHKGGRVDPGAYDSIAGNHQNARSSHNEDRFAIRYFGGAGNWTSSRTFLEIGAFDGVTESNTIIMERCLGWRGVLIEPNPRAFDALKASGRTHSTLVQACVEINQCVGCVNSSLSHFSAMTLPCWLRRTVGNRHRHAIEQASHRWRGGRRDDSARARRKILISTQILTRASGLISVTNALMIE